MGAEFTDTTAVGKDASSAFRAARERDQYEYGHGGYSGSLAEKHDFFMVALPARMTARKFIDLALEACDGVGDTGALEYERDELRPGGWVRQHYTKAEIRKREVALRKMERAHDRFWKSVPVAARPAVRAAASSLADKWGPACGIELRGAEATAAKKRHGVGGTRQRAFMFFGYCSS